MRLWHYKLIPYLPKSQLLAQWRELNSIFKKQNKHILINYIYEYPKADLEIYTCMVIAEMKKRGFRINNLQNAIFYFQWSDEFAYKYLPNMDKMEFDKWVSYPPFKNHHNYRYLQQCYHNLEEKYDRGQFDFSKEEYESISKLVRQEDFKNFREALEKEGRKVEWIGYSVEDENQEEEKVS